MERLAAFVLAAALLALPFAAMAGPRCDLALVLLQDTSSSLDNAELDQMRAGLAGALTDQRLASSFGRASVQVLVVSYGASPSVVVDWFPASREGLAAAAAAILDMPRAAMGGTATGDAIAFALDALDAMPCSRKVIDVATDGLANVGRSPASVLADADPFGVQVNGLVIGSPEDLVHFQETTQFGAGGFTAHAETFDDFGLAMLRKLSIEVSMNITGGSHAL